MGLMDGQLGQIGSFRNYSAPSPDAPLDGHLHKTTGARLQVQTTVGTVVPVGASAAGPNGRNQLDRPMAFKIRAVGLGGLAIFGVVELAVGQSQPGVGALSALVVYGGLAFLVYKAVGWGFARQRSADDVYGRAPASAS